MKAISKLLLNTRCADVIQQNIRRLKAEYATRGINAVCAFKNRAGGKACVYVYESEHKLGAPIVHKQHKKHKKHKPHKPHKHGAERKPETKPRKAYKARANTVRKSGIQYTHSVKYYADKAIRDAIKTKAR